MTTRSEQAKTVMKWAKSIAMPKMPKKTGDKWNEKKNNIQRKMKEKKGNRKGPRKKKNKCAHNQIKIATKHGQNTEMSEETTISITTITHIYICMHCIKHARISNMHQVRINDGRFSVSAEINAHRKMVANKMCQHKCLNDRPLAFWFCLFDTIRSRINSTEMHTTTVYVCVMSRICYRFYNDVNLLKRCCLYRVEINEFRF